MAALEIEDSQVFDDWLDFVMDEVRNRIPGRASKHGIPMSQSSRIALGKLKKLLVITPVDKATRNPFFVCKRLHREIVNNELRIVAHTLGLIVTLLRFTRSIAIS